MKKVIILIGVLSFFGCKPVQKEDNEKNEVAQAKENHCPEDGECTVKLSQNSSLEIKEDTIGSFYPVTEKGDNLVVEFKFHRDGPEGTVDGHYSETIHFEVPSTNQKIILRDGDLQQINLYYGKHCFCRGEAGYYKVSQGNIVVEITDGWLSFDLTFKMENVSHEITKVKRSIKI